MNEQAAPFACHIFVCVNDRHGERKSCADGKSAELKDYLKNEVDRRGLKPRVRVSSSGCMGLCQKGPNVLLHPQGIWFNAVTLPDAGKILTRVEQLVGKSAA